MSTPTQHEKIHGEMFKRLNEVESKVDNTNGYLRGDVESNEKIIKQNDKLITLIEKRDASQGRIVWALLVLLFFALGVIAFGAIGKEGMHSVRKTMPTVPTAAIPAHNDFDKWQYRHKV